MSTSIVIADTSVLINFLCIDRIDLIGEYPASFIATEHVGTEISDGYPDQRSRYQSALDASILTKEKVDNKKELDIFLRLSRQYPRLGSGERSAVAVASKRGHALAIDDKYAIKKALYEAGLANTNLSIIRTQDIITTLIQTGTLTVEASDVILTDWANNHRFFLNISSLSDTFTPSGKTGQLRRGSQREVGNPRTLSEPPGLS